METGWLAEDAACAAERRNLVWRQGLRFGARHAAEVAIGQSGALAEADDGAARQVGQGKVGHAVAAVGRADAGEQCGVAGDRNQLAVGDGEAARDDAAAERLDLADIREIGRVLRAHEVGHPKGRLHGVYGDAAAGDRASLRDPAGDQPERSGSGQSNGGTMRATGAMHGAAPRSERAGNAAEGAWRGMSRLTPPARNQPTGCSVPDVLGAEAHADNARRQAPQQGERAQASARRTAASASRWRAARC